MSFLRFTEADVLAMLPMSEAIECLRTAFAAFSRGEAQSQPRRRLILPSGSVLHSMAAAVGGYYGTKVYSTNAKFGADFTVLLYDAATGRPLAQFEANHLGQIRTGAASGLATDLLTEDKELDVAVIGSGFQARSQIAGVRAVRNLRRVRVWSRSEASRERFASDTGSEAAQSAGQACDGADIIITATHSKDPVIPPEAVKETALILAMGANTANRREIPAEIVKRSRIIVDDVAQCKLEAGDLLLAGIDWNAVETLGQVLASKQAANPPDQPTLFKSVGIALEDIAVAGHIFEKATLGQSSAGPNRATR